MKVIDKYFRTTEGPLIAAVQECLDANREAGKKFEPILAELGATAVRHDSEGQLVAVEFPGNPYRVVGFRKTGRSGWYPATSTAGGIRLLCRLSQITVKPLRGALLAGGLPSVFVSKKTGRSYASRVAVKTGPPLVVFVSAPSSDDGELFRTCPSWGERAPTAGGFQLQEVTQQQMQDELNDTGETYGN